MSATELQHALDTLHRELASTDDVDAETRAMLAGAMREIAAKLEGKAAAVEGPVGLSEKVRGAVQHFEGRHAALVNAVGRVADALAAAGL